MLNDREHYLKCKKYFQYCFYFHKLPRNVKNICFPLRTWKYFWIQIKGLLIYTQMPFSGHSLKRPVPPLTSSPPSHSGTIKQVLSMAIGSQLPSGMPKSMDLPNTVPLLMHLNLHRSFHSIEWGLKAGGFFCTVLKTFIFILSTSSNFLQYNVLLSKYEKKTNLNVFPSSNCKQYHLLWYN